MEKLNLTELHGAVIGMVLGDAHIQLNSRHGRLLLCHGLEQEPYLLWKGKILEQLCKVYVSKDGRCCRLNTYRHPFYTQLYSHLYLDGKRIVDGFSIKILTPLGMAIWYMDDGTLTLSHPERGTVNYEVGLCMFRTSEPEFERVSKILADKWHLEWRVVCRQVDNQKLYSFRLRWKDHAEFFHLISKYINEVPCMQYKLPPQWRASSVTEDGDIVCSSQKCEELPRNEATVQPVMVG